MYQRRRAAVITLSLENNFCIIIDSNMQHAYAFTYIHLLKLVLIDHVSAAAFFFSSLGFCRAVTFTDTSERRNFNNCTRTEKLNDLTREKEKDQNPIQLISIHASWFLSYYQNSSYVIFTMLLEILDFYVFINFILFFKLWWPTK